MGFSACTNETPIRIFTLWVQLTGKPAFYKVGQRVETLLNELYTNREQGGEQVGDRASPQALGSLQTLGGTQMKLSSAPHPFS